MLFIRIFLLATNYCYSVTIDTLMGGYHIAVVGATGAAGTELLRVPGTEKFSGRKSASDWFGAFSREIRAILR